MVPRRPRALLQVGDASPVSLFPPAVTRTTPGLGTSAGDRSVDIASSCPLSVELQTPQGSPLPPELPEPCGMGHPR